MIDHCVAEFQQRQKVLAYQRYVADGIKVISENTAKFVGGSYLTKYFVDLINHQEDERTGDEIAEEIIRKAGLTLKGGRGQ